MGQWIRQFSEKFSQNEIALVAGNFLLVFFLILFANLGILPVRNFSDFIFFAFLGLAFALYRPGWAFLFFIGTVALESVNLAPDKFGLAIRPYQLIGGLTIAAMAIKFAVGKLNFKLLKIRWYDGLVILIAVASFVSALAAANKTVSLKLSVILASFVLLYFLVRNFVTTVSDVKKIVPVIFSSGIVVVAYGIWQNFRFSRGFSNFEVMPGRPNSVFPEADWLGMYLILFIALLCAWAVFLEKRKNNSEDIVLPLSVPKVVLGIFFILALVLLIITVARSAWLGAFVVLSGYLFIELTGLKFRPKLWQWKNFFLKAAGVISAVVLSGAIVWGLHLTDFQLLNRAQSTVSGLQKITIACVPGSESPERVSTVEELEKFGCRHINLEAIEQELAEGNQVTEIYRNDPNINIRSSIYSRAWSEIKNHPLFGIGWGGIGGILGVDGRGVGLNSSNIFLEIWLGSGIIGFLAFVVLWIYVLLRAAHAFLHRDGEGQAVALFIILAWAGLTVFNLFNAGIMLAIFWVFLAVSLMDYKAE